MKRVHARIQLQAPQVSAQALCCKKEGSAPAARHYTVTPPVLTHLGGWPPCHHKRPVRFLCKHHDIAHYHRELPVQLPRTLQKVHAALIVDPEPIRKICMFPAQKGDIQFDLIYDTGSTPAH